MGESAGPGWSRLGGTPTAIPPRATRPSPSPEGLEENAEEFVKDYVQKGGE